MDFSDVRASDAYLQMRSSDLQVDLADDAVHASYRHCVRIRNTFIDVDEAISSPAIGRQRAQTSMMEFSHANTPKDTIQDSQFDNMPEESQSTFSGEPTDWDECAVSESSSGNYGGLERNSARMVTVWNTFMDGDSDEDLTTPRQRAQTWHGKSSLCDTLSPFAVDDDGKFLGHTDSEPSDDVEEGTTYDCASSEYASRTPSAFEDSCEHENLSNLVNRVHAPPPLCRIDSPVNGFCMSSTGTVSTTTSSNCQTCQLEVVSMPSVTSNASNVHAFDCAVSTDFSQHLGALGSLQFISGVAHRSNGTLLTGFHNFPMSSPSTGAITTSVMPPYGFAYPPVAYVPLPNAGFFAGPLQQQIPTHDSSPTPRTCNGDDTGVDSIQNLNVGCPLLPSIGSAGHHRGICKPCAFGSERCRSKQNCEFCHICKPMERSKRGRWILKRRKNFQELQTELMDLQHVLQGTPRTDMAVP